LIEMFEFERAQVIFNIGGVELGGQPGELPTVLVGSIFYDGDKAVIDPLRGVFDGREAESLINRQEEMSDKTGNPHFIDVVGQTAKALIRYIDFVSELTEAPFLIDGPSPAVRLPAVRHCIEVGLGERAIYNSIDENVREEEVEVLREEGLTAAVVLAFNSLDPRPEGRMALLRGSHGRSGLLDAASRAGVEKILVDVAVLDTPSIGASARTIHMVKSEFGLPAGCAPSNAVTAWKSLKLLGEYARSTCIASSHAILPAFGADFLLYGPIKYAEMVFPACAMVDAFMGYDARWRGIKPRRSHPLYKVL